MNTTIALVCCLERTSRRRKGSPEVFLSDKATEPEAKMARLHLPDSIGEERALQRESMLWRATGGSSAKHSSAHHVESFQRLGVEISAPTPLLKKGVGNNPWRLHKARNDSCSHRTEWKTS